MYSIPTTVTVNGIEYRIRNNGDFRTILDCFSALADTELSQTERLCACLIIFYADINTIDDLDIFGNDLQNAVSAMYEFFRCGNNPAVGTKVNHKLIDWEQDSQLICSAINKVAGKEIRLESYLHWWTFMGYYTAIGESPLSTIISIRDKIVRGKKLEKAEKQFKAENPQYFTWNSRTIEDSEADKLIRELWNNTEE